MTRRPWPRYASPGWIAAYAIGVAAWVGIALASWTAAELVLGLGVWLFAAAAGALTRGDQ